jgi:hypothetical protein
MAGFILQVLASSCFALELEESQPVSLFSSYFACDQFTGCPATPVVPIENICGFSQFFQPSVRILPSKKPGSPRTRSFKIV